MSAWRSGTGASNLEERQGDYFSAAGDGAYKTYSLMTGWTSLPTTPFQTSLPCMAMSEHAGHLEAGVVWIAFYNH